METVGNKTVTFRAEPHIRAELERISKAQKWTMGQTLRYVLEEYLPHRDSLLRALKQQQENGTKEA